MFRSICDSQESKEEELEIKRWQIESLVTCVPRLLLVEVAFSLISTPTVSVEVRDTTVHSAISHLGKLLI